MQGNHCVSPTDPAYWILCKWRINFCFSFPRLTDHTGNELCHLPRSCGQFGPIVSNFKCDSVVRLETDPTPSFWILGIPILAAFVAVFLWRDIIRAWHYLRKKTVLARLVRALSSRHSSDVFEWWALTTSPLVLLGTHANLDVLMHWHVDRITSL
jgi:hypothetical protein